MVPGLLENSFALAGTWLGHSVLQGSQKLTTVAVNAVTKQGSWVAQCTLKEMSRNNRLDHSETEKRSHSATGTHCLCRQENGGQMSLIFRVRQRSALVGHCGLWDRERCGLSSGSGLEGFQVSSNHHSFLFFLGGGVTPWC